MSKQHTQTPYILKGLSENGKKHFNIIGSKLGHKYRICRVPFTDSEFDKDEAEANAKFIVKACNNHDRLVEALEKIIRNTPLGVGHLDAFQEAKQLLTELKS